MGQRFTRPFRNINVENRAAKVLEKQQAAPVAAPKHAGTLDAVSQLKQDAPEILEEMDIKDQQLHENLKQIYLETEDPPIKITSAAPLKQLSRSATGDQDLGVMDVGDGEAPQGRSSLRGIMGFMALHQEDPKQNPAASIAQSHNLEEAAVQNVLAHFKVMQLHIPQEMYKETKNMGKVMAAQLQASEKVASSFRLEGQEKESLKSIPGSPDTTASKT